MHVVPVQKGKLPKVDRKVVFALCLVREFAVVVVQGADGRVGENDSHSTSA